MQNHPNILVEEQFKIMADTAPVLIWISGLDKLCYFFNAGWLRFTGRTMEQEYGNGWADGVHPEDFQRCLATYVNSFDQRVNFTMEYRLKRHDGIYRWVTDNGVPRYLDDGTFAGFIGTCVDVHELLEEQRIKIETLNHNALLKEKQLNEQLGVINEELASSNEELVAANEELISAQESIAKMNEDLEAMVVKRTTQLAINEQRYRGLVDCAPVAIGTLTGRNLTITSANDMILKVWGKSPEIVGKQLKDALPELKEQPFLHLLDEVFTTSKAFHGYNVKAMLEHNGELKEHYFDFIYTPLGGEDGITESIIVVANDVTEQVDARKKIEHASLRLHSMVMTAPIGMTILKGRDLYIEIANQPMLEVWHRTKEEVLGKQLWDVFPEIISTEFPLILDNVFDSGQPYKIPEVLSPHPEQKTYISISYDPLFDSDGRVESILVTVIDITEVVDSRTQIEQSQSALQAINEELLASNEELLASNDHLELVRLELEKSMASVIASENKFRFMVNAIPQQVWTAHTNGALNFVNDVVCHNFGYTANEIVGQGWQNFIHAEDLVMVLEQWNKSLESGQEYVVEFRLRFIDGLYYWHLGRAVPLIEDGKIILWLGTNTNIQSQKHNEEMKDEFLSIASHELKTPLTTIKAYNQMMSRSSQPERLEMFLKKSSDQIYRLEKLITDLLDVTKINAGKISYNMENFDFTDMLIASIESMQHVSPNHQLIFKKGCAIDYHGDRFRLEQVVHNFLSNAVKYSPKGKIVQVKCNLDNEKIVVAIQDFGIGIAKENLDKLSNRYYRVDNSAMRFDGLGLGLFISSEILKRHQGSFWIDSTEGEGSTFYFSLPFNVS